MTIIEFANVSKRFILHLNRPRSFRDRLTGIFSSNTHGEEFWALRDVSFKIEKGQSLGLIGHNGAGKSTALKLMTRILEPTSGQVRMRGRVAALLELGSGFHPDLSGRENVFLYGSLMGFSRRDMLARLDEIVDFADIGEFIDTEIKHYSSGMYTRLAFAVATAVDPEILITDEVLAVGDEAFQRKCMERIYSFRQAGKTIIFVSHALEIVRSLCDHAVWLDRGEARCVGTADEVIDSYLQETNRREARERQRHTTAQSWEDADAEQSKRWGTREIEIKHIELLGPKGTPQDLYYTGEPLTIRYHYRANIPINDPQFGLAIYHGSGVHVTGPNNRFSGYPIASVHGSGIVDYTIPNLPLLPGMYYLTVAVHDANGLVTFDHHERAYRFTVRSHSLKTSYGLIELPARWVHAATDG